MEKYAIVKNNLVVNVIEYEGQPSNPPPGFEEGTIAVQSNTAGVGFIYSDGAFVAPKPFPSWVLDGNTWIPPVPYSQDPNKFAWDEATLSWVNPADTSKPQT